MKQIEFIKNKRMHFFLKDNCYYVFVHNHFFLKQEILPLEKNVSVCTPEVYYFFYVLFVLERFGLINRFYH